MTLALLWRYRAALGWTLVVGLALTLWTVNNHKQQEIGMWREKARQSAEQTARLQTAIADTKRLYQRDTVVVSRLTTEYDTLYRDRETRITDTVYVKAALAKGDSVVRACRRVLADCNVLLAQKDTLIGQLHTQLGLQTKLSKPSTLGLVVKLGAAVGVGYLIGRGH